MSVIRRRLVVTGQVQGVGFRPFVYRLAVERDLTGTVGNTSQGVVVEIQGPAEAVAGFERAFPEELPPLARVTRLETSDAEPVPNEQGFAILKSEGGHGHHVLISPDIATCADCLADMADPGNRRHDYPFTNCTNCGPRYTITRSIPYDRPVTSMACFPLCPDCQAEYENPLDRRFHAQPNACPVCGPQVWLADQGGKEISRGDQALTELAERLAHGEVAGIKGLGGFHLACDARSSEAVSLLRERKHRPHKPLAVMVPDLDAAKALAEIGPAEAEHLAGSRRPIVLLRERPGCSLCPEIAPDTDYVGLMLPYTPLHHVLLARAKKAGTDALVMTSGNFSGEPICLGNREALMRLGHLADCFLFHNRDILVRTDDSVLRVLPDTGEPQFMRRARGFVPEPVFLENPEDTGHSSDPSVLGLGPELKCTLTLTKDGQAFVSQHVGEMENLAVLGFWRETLAHLRDILQVEPELIVRDLHPDYLTSRLAPELAEELGVPVAPLQHHFAHIHAVLAERGAHGPDGTPVVGLALDGTGFGEDGSIWGGEVLYVNPRDLAQRRLAGLATFGLPGGEAAVNEPWRIGQSLLWEMGEHDPTPDRARPWLPEKGGEAGLVVQMLDKGVNCPRTSSAGRLFDGVSALLGLCLEISYEGQAPIRLEQAQDLSESGAYECPLVEVQGLGGDNEPDMVDGLALARAVVRDIRAGTAPGIIARRFHLGFCQGMARAAAHHCAQLGLDTVALSGGVMQNLTVALELRRALEGLGLKVLAHRQMPPGDGCISLGQSVWGRRSLQLGLINS